MVASFTANEVPAVFVEQYSPGSQIYSDVWERIIDAAEHYTSPIWNTP